MHILLAVVSKGGACSLGFAVSLMRLQNALATAPNVTITMDTASSVREAAQQALQAGMDAVVVVRSTIAFPAGFVLRALVAPSDFVAGVYPLPTVDWQRVVDRAGGAEETRFRGNTYNLDASKATAVAAPGYMAVREAELGAVVLKKDALATAAACEGSSDKELCAAWGKDVYVDLDNQCASTGPVEFTGCVGMRTVLR